MSSSSAPHTERARTAHVIHLQIQISPLACRTMSVEWSGRLFIVYSRRARKTSM